MKCRHCTAELTLPLIDLGTSPPSNAYLRPEQLAAPERWFPLRVLVCTRCWLAQTEDFASADELFDADYAYFSSYSLSWLGHAERYVAAMAAALALGPHSMVVEVAANDGYLLQYVRARGIPCLGIEPTASTAAAAEAKGLSIVRAFFGRQLAQSLRDQGHGADLMVANNVLAHVPDINDFVAGFAVLLKPDGVATFEFPHLQRLVEGCQFDTIYHEHFSYLSLLAVDSIFASNGLQIFDVAELPTHGGSLRVFAQRADRAVRPRNATVAAMLARERAIGMAGPAWYGTLQLAAERIKHDLLAFLVTEKRAGRTVAGYGAAAKGNTLLNWAGVRPDLLPWVVDANPAKQGKRLPGSRILVSAPERLAVERPDTVLILPWNLRDEIRALLGGGQRIAIAVPRLEVT